MSIATEWDERLSAVASGQEPHESVSITCSIDDLGDLRALVEAAMELERLRPSWLPKGDPEVDRRLDAVFAEQEQNATRKKILKTEDIRRAEFEKTRERCASKVETCGTYYGRQSERDLLADLIRLLPFEGS